MFSGSASHPAARPGLSRTEVLVAAGAVLAAGLAAPFALRSIRESRRAACAANLTILGRAMQDYVRANGDRWPFVARLPSMEYHHPPWPALPEVLMPFLADQPPTVFRCPSDRRLLPPASPLRARFPARTTYFETEGTSYEWVLQELLAGQSPGRDLLTRTGGIALGRSEQPIVWEFEPFHARGGEPGGLNVLFADFKVRREAGPSDRAEARR